MKLPKSFFFFLFVTQAIITLGHALLSSALTYFFPFFAVHEDSLLTTLILLSVSFLVLSLLEFNVESPILRYSYILSAIWIPTWFYLLLASFLSLIGSFIFPKSSVGLAATIYSCALALSLYGVINARVIRVTNLPIKLPNLPELWKGKTAVMVSDLHLGHVLRYGFAGRVIAKINHLRPDIVFIPGDFFDGVKTNFVDLANLFRAVKVPKGIYYVSGNHEQIAGYKVCEEAIAGAGIHILENAKVEVDGLQIVGTAYQHETVESLAELFAAMGIDRERPSIYLKHVPNHFEAAEQAGISLQLSGHSHRGQLWPGNWITRAIWKGYDYGLKKFGPAMQVFTSSGVGTWGPPLRVGSRSEVVRITFL